MPKFSSSKLMVESVRRKVGVGVGEGKRRWEPYRNRDEKKNQQERKETR